MSLRFFTNFFTLKIKYKTKNVTQKNYTNSLLNIKKIVPNKLLEMHFQHKKAIRNARYKCHYNRIYFSIISWNFYFYNFFLFLFGSHLFPPT